jgi:hypothetical protein
MGFRQSFNEFFWDVLEVGFIAMFVHLQLEEIFFLHDVIHELHKKKMGVFFFFKINLEKPDDKVK